MNVRRHRRRPQMAAAVALLGLAVTVAAIASHWWFCAISASRVPVFIGDHTIDFAHWPWQASPVFRSAIRYGPVGERPDEWRCPWRPMRTENVVTGHGVSMPLWNIAVLSGSQALCCSAPDAEPHPASARGVATALPETSAAGVRNAASP